MLKFYYIAILKYFSDAYLDEVNANFSKAKLSESVVFTKL